MNGLALIYVRVWLPVPDVDYMANLSAFGTSDSVQITFGVKCIMACISPPSGLNESLPGGWGQPLGSFLSTSFSHQYVQKVAGVDALSLIKETLCLAVSCILITSSVVLDCSIR